MVVDTNWTYVENEFDFTGALDGENPESQWIHNPDNIALTVDGINVNLMNPGLIENINILRGGLAAALLNQHPGLINMRDDYLEEWIELSKDAKYSVEYLREQTVQIINKLYNRNVFSDRRVARKYDVTQMSDDLIQSFNSISSENIKVEEVNSINPTHDIYPTLIRGNYYFESELPDTGMKLLLDLSVLNEGEAIVIHFSRILGAVEAGYKESAAKAIGTFIEALKAGGTRKVYKFETKNNAPRITELTLFKNKTRINDRKIPKIL